MSNDEITNKPESLDVLLDLSRIGAEIRRGPGGKQAIVPYTRLDKPEPEKDKKTIDKKCDFCPTNWKLSEVYFSGELAQLMLDRGLFVKDNKFPTVLRTSDVDTRYIEPLGIFHDRKLAKGRHLVMIETPDHNLDPFLPSSEIANYYQNLVWGYIQMLRELRREGFGTYEWGAVIKNRNGVGKDGNVINAGASQPHPHSQAIALEKMPNWLEEYLLPSSSYEKGITTDSLGMVLGGCTGCLEVRDSTGVRGVFRDVTIETNGIYTSSVARIPEPNPFHVQIKIVPINHQSLFDEMTEQEAYHFADILHKTMVAVGFRYTNCGFNFELVQGPWKSRHRDNRLYHWECNIYPAWPELKTIRYDGVMSHLLRMAIPNIPPEHIAREINQNKR